MKRCTQPAWISEPLSPYDIAAILRGGCASGAYMPAVTYWQAAETMAGHGDDVLDYIVDRFGELPKPQDDTSRSGLACFFLSWAVELWCFEHEELAQHLAGGQVSPEPHAPREAEPAAHGATHLGGDADGVALPVREVDRLDLLAVREFQQSARGGCPSSWYGLGW